MLEKEGRASHRSLLPPHSHSLHHRMPRLLCRLHKTSLLCAVCARARLIMPSHLSLLFGCWLTHCSWPAHCFSLLRSHCMHLFLHCTHQRPLALIICLLHGWEEEGGHCHLTQHHHLRLPAFAFCCLFLPGILSCCTHHHAPLLLFLFLFAALLYFLAAVCLSLLHHGMRTLLRRVSFAALLLTVRTSWLLGRKRKEGGKERDRRRGEEDRGRTRRHAPLFTHASFYGCMLRIFMPCTRLSFAMQEGTEGNWKRLCIALMPLPCGRISASLAFIFRTPQHFLCLCLFACSTHSLLTPLFPAATHHLILASHTACLFACHLLFASPRSITSLLTASLCLCQHLTSASLFCLLLRRELPLPTSFTCYTWKKAAAGRQARRAEGQAGLPPATSPLYAMLLFET